MLAPTDETKLSRLSNAVEKSYAALLPFRKLCHGLVEEYAGSGYGNDSVNRHETVVNLMNQTVDAYTMALVANRPRVKMSTKIPDQEFFAKHFEIGVNNLIEEIGLEFTLKQWVLDAFFCIGIIKVHLADSGYVMLEEDRYADPGKPFASNVSLDNFVFDKSATKWDQVKFAGDSYRIPFEDLQQDIYDQEVVAQLTPGSKQDVSADRLESFTRGTTVDDDELEPMIDLCDIWIPREGKIYTFALENRSTFKIKSKPLAVMDWTGDERGPYFLLGFNDVPENIMPTSPASQLGSLSRMANNLIRKQSRQAQRQKTVTTYTAANKDDAEAIKRSSDGDMLAVNDVQDIGTLKFGGTDPGNQQFFLGVMDMYDRMAGNLTAMLGLGAQADTASQEQLIHGAVNKKEAQMQYRVVDGTVRVIKSLAFMLWNDQANVIPGQLEIPGAPGYEMDASWTPDYRVGGFEDYNLDIDIFSMTYQSPSQRVTAINQLLTQVYGPMMQLMTQQGGSINMKELVNLHADLLNLPQLAKVVQFASLPAPMAQQDQGGMPASTTRNYVRRNVPTGGTAASRSTVMQQALAGMAANNDQGSSISRPPA